MNAELMHQFLFLNPVSESSINVTKHTLK